MDVSAIIALPATAAHPVDLLARAARVLHSAVEGRVIVASGIDGLREALAAEGLSDLTVVELPASASHADCLEAALHQISTSHVLVHNMAVPLITADVVARVIEGLRRGADVSVPTLAVTDSVKAVDWDGTVVRTVDRASLKTVQYPRGFAVDALTRLHSDGIDDALAAGLSVQAVDGDPDGFRAELPGDARFVEAIIASRR